MEVYILDSLYRRIDVVDEFESLIWTERFKDVGDFELVIQSTADSRSTFTNGTMLAINESYRVMVVDTVEDKNAADGTTMLTVKGKSLEKILDDRVAHGVMAGLTATPQWVLTGTPTAIARQVFHDICVAGVLDPNDVIDLIHEGSSIFPASTIAEPTGSITVKLDPATVLKVLKDFGDVYDLGFRLFRNLDTSQLWFDIYMGSDRTTGQSTLPAVIFSPELDNLQDTTELDTTAAYKNVAYVFSPDGYDIVYGDQVDPSVKNFDRHVLLVDANDIPAGTGSAAARQQRGKEELAKNRRLRAFDGEINQNSEYKYGRDYHLGDLVELRNTDGVTNNMQVIEQIFVSDREGERSYPTLAMNLFITPGTWLAWDYNQEWSDLNTDPTVWADA